MISTLSLNLFLKFITIGHKLSAFPFYYDKGTCKLASVGPAQRKRWLIMFVSNHIYGNIQVLVVLWRAFIDAYPVGLLLQEFMIPIGYGLYSLMSVLYMIYEKELVNLLNQHLSTNKKLSKKNNIIIKLRFKSSCRVKINYSKILGQAFWILHNEKDGLELLIVSFLNNTVSILLFRVALLFLFDKFNNLYAYYLFKMGPGGANLLLRISIYLWDWLTTAEYMISSTTSGIIFFIFINSNKLWCKKMM